MNEKLTALFNRIKADSNFLTVSEAQTSQGIILPILNNLHWDVFDTTEVMPEYSVGGKRVDFALRIQGQNKVFLEIKKTSEDLEKHQEQLVYYSFQQGVKLAILTNGITWWFYLPLEEGGWEQRKFFTVDLLEQSIDDAVKKFESLLTRTNIETGVAYQNAKSLYDGGQKNKIINENLPKAWRKLISEPDEMLVELLNDTLEKISGYKAEDRQIIEFLHQTFNLPNSLPPFQKKQNTLLKEKSVTVFPKETNINNLIQINLESVDDLTYTKILDGKFNNESSASWRTLLKTGLKIAFERGIHLDVLKNELNANFKPGLLKKDGYRPVEGTNFSLQGQDANNTLMNIFKLAKLLHCPFSVLFEWQEKGKYPSKQGLIEWKP